MPERNGCSGAHETFTEGGDRDERRKGIEGGEQSTAHPGPPEVPNACSLVLSSGVHPYPRLIEPHAVNVLGHALIVIYLWGGEYHHCLHAHTNRHTERETHSSVVRRVDLIHAYVLVACRGDETTQTSVVRQQALTASPTTNTHPHTCSCNESFVWSDGQCIHMLRRSTAIVNSKHTS